MPFRPPAPCTTPGCSKYAKPYSSKCEEHQPPKRQAWRKRDGAAKRSSRPWARQRQRVLIRDDYLCQPCKRAGRVTGATEVDHITPLEEGGSRSDDNCESICKPCHRAKTRAESARGRARQGAGDG